MCIKQIIHTRTSSTKFRRISPLVIAPVTEAHKAWTRSYSGPFRRFINKKKKKKSIKKEWTETIIKKKKRSIAANTSPIWEHGGHTTDQLTFSSC